MEKSAKTTIFILIAIFSAMPAFYISAATPTLADPVSAGTIRGGAPVSSVGEPAATSTGAVAPASLPAATPAVLQGSSPSPTLPIPTESSILDLPTESVDSGQIGTTFQEPVSSPPAQEPNMPLIAAFIAGAAALGFGLYKMIGGQARLPIVGQAQTDGKNDDKNQKNKCNLIKATLDAKLKELTDLEGRVKGKIKGAIKDTIEGVLLTEAEKAVLKKIEGAKGEYEKLKVLYEECIADIDSGKTKTLKFRAFKADMILKGEKTSSLRLFDDKDLKAGVELTLINWDTKKPFGKAKVTEVIEKKLGEIGGDDLLGHEPLEGGPVENLKKYYGGRVSPETTGKIVRFKLEK